MIKLKNLLVENIEEKTTMYFLIGKNIPKNIAYLGNSSIQAKNKACQYPMDGTSFSIALTFPNPNMNGWLMRLEKNGWSKQQATELFHHACYFYRELVGRFIKEPKKKNSTPTFQKLPSAYDGRYVAHKRPF